MYDARETSGESEPSWEEATRSPSDPLPAHADVCVIGAGVAGLSTAYQLSLEGRSVVVIDKGELGAGETARSTAHLTSAVDDRFYLLERMHGLVGARLVRESHAAAIDRIEAIAREESIDCDFERVDGFLFAAESEPVGELDDELEASIRAGLSVSRIPRAPLTFDTGPCLRFSGQAQIDPVKYLQGLARAVRERGGLLVTSTRVASIAEGAPCTVTLVGDATLTADDVVVATNTPVNETFAMHTKQASYRSYVIAVEIVPGSVEPGLYWDTADPYHYVRLQGRDLLIVGGEDHKAGQAVDPEESWQRLEEWTRERFESAGDVRSRWSGQVQEPSDGVAFIGHAPGHSEHVFIATGDSGDGMTHGAIAGILLADLVCGRDNPWAALYDPGRKVSSLHALRSYVKENVNVAMQYGDWLVPHGRSTKNIPRGEGAIRRRGLRPIAVFVDERGVSHECSAVCPHLGGLVAWNRAERSWDCPCHGSRFSPLGEVLTGPATANLAPLGSPEVVEQPTAAKQPGVHVRARDTAS